MAMVIWQHVPFEGPAFLQEWAGQRGLPLVLQRVWEAPPPAPGPEARLLVVLGGPMGVHDTAQYPWLAAEKRQLRAAIDSGLPVLGICLGAQLLAEVLGAAVSRNAWREIGWFDVVRDDAIAGSWLGALWPARLRVLHWHGDAFAIPPGAQRIAASAACANQGFVHGERVIGLQCHLETTAAALQQLIDHAGDELDGSRHVQDAAALQAGLPAASAMHAVLARILEGLLARKEAA